MLARHTIPIEWQNRFIPSLKNSHNILSSQASLQLQKKVTINKTQRSSSGQAMGTVSQASRVQRHIAGGNMTDLYDVNVALLDGELYAFERGLYV